MKNISILRISMMFTIVFAVICGVFTEVFEIKRQNYIEIGFYKSILMPTYLCIIFAFLRDIFIGISILTLVRIKRLSNINHSTNKTIEINQDYIDRQQKIIKVFLFLQIIFIVMVCISIFVLIQRIDLYIKSSNSNDHFHYIYIFDIAFSIFSIIEHLILFIIFTLIKNEKKKYIKDLN